MFEEKVLQSVAMQLMNGEEVVLDDQKLRVKRVGSGRLRRVQFELNGRKFEAIEQNRMKPSRYAAAEMVAHPPTIICSASRPSSKLRTWARSLPV